MRIRYWLRIKHLNIDRGIRSCIRWFPTIWKDNDWDWSFLTQLMETKFRNMSNYFEKDGCCVDHKQQAKETLICAELLKRIIEDDTIEDNIFSKNRIISNKFHERRMQGWKEMLFKLMDRKLETWWD